MDETIKGYLYNAIFAVLTGAVGIISKAIISLKNKNEATQNGVKALLRDRIIATYDLYMDKGYMPIYARENLDEMYKEYKKLKGNGVIDHLKDELNELPTKKRSDK